MVLRSNIVIPMDHACYLYFGAYKVNERLEQLQRLDGHTHAQDEDDDKSKFQIMTETNQVCH